MDWRNQFSEVILKFFPNPKAEEILSLQGFIDSVSEIFKALEMETDYEVIFKESLVSFDGGSPCEVCNNPMNAHEWVLMSRDGYVVKQCSFQPKFSGK